MCDAGERGRPEDGREERERKRERGGYKGFRSKKENPEG